MCYNLSKKEVSLNRIGVGSRIECTGLKEPNDLADYSYYQRLCSLFTHRYCLGVQVPDEGQQQAVLKFDSHPLLIIGEDGYYNDYRTYLTSTPTISSITEKRSLKFINTCGLTSSQIAVANLSFIPSFIFTMFGINSCATATFLSSR